MIPVDYRLQKYLSDKLKLSGKVPLNYRIEVDKMQYMPGLQIGGFFETVVKNSTTSGTTQMTDAVLVTLGDGNTSTSSCNSAHLLFPSSTYSSWSAVPKSRGFYYHNEKDKHYGVDFAVPSGTPIYAPWDGTVTNIAHQQGYGIVMFINHGGTHKVYTAYGHCRQFLVNVGDKVTRGQQIAFSGGQPGVDPDDTIGDSDGAHLHFEIRLPGKGDYNGNPNYPVDPAPYLWGGSCLFPGTDMSSQNTNVTSSQPFNGNLNRVWSEMLGSNPFTTGNKYINSATWGYSVQPVTSGETGRGYLYSRLTDNGTNLLNVTYDPSKNSVITITFSTEGFGNGDSLTITADGKTVYGPNLQGANGENHVINFAVPANTATIQFQHYSPGGHHSVVGIGEILIDEVDPSVDTNVDTSHTVTQSFKNMMTSGYRTVSKKHPFGKFVVSDTLTLDNVMDITLTDQFDQSTQELQITVANPNGFYSPDYNPGLFPELKLPPSPWSYEMDGIRVGVLSENTPIRLYLGYGDRTTRMFTGKIGKVETSGNDATLSITCYGMYKVLMNRVILYDMLYPDLTMGDSMKNYAWLKSSIVQDLVTKAGLSDYVIEESTFIGAQPYTDNFYALDSSGNMKSVSGAAYNLQTPYGYVNPYVAPIGTTFQRGSTYDDALHQLLQDTQYRAYCDRNGTFRMERLEYTQIVSAILNEGDNMITIGKSLDHSKTRSHLQLTSWDGNVYDAYDDELLIALKGELRSAGATLDYPIPASATDIFEAVASRFFLDMKRVARTLTVAIAGDPTIELMDRVLVKNRETMTNHEYMVKGIKHSVSKEGWLTYLDLTWDVNSEGGDTVA